MFLHFCLLSYMEQGCSSPHPIATRLLVQRPGNCVSCSSVSSRSSSCLWLSGKMHKNCAIGLSLLLRGYIPSRLYRAQSPSAAQAALLSAHTHPVLLKRGLLPPRCCELRLGSGGGLGAPSAARVRASPAADVHGCCSSLQEPRLTWPLCCVQRSWRSVVERLLWLTSSHQCTLRAHI